MTDLYDFCQHDMYIYHLRKHLWHLIQKILRHITWYTKCGIEFSKPISYRYLKHYARPLELVLIALTFYSLSITKHLKI